MHTHVSLALQAAALKNVSSKGVMKKPWAKAMGAANQYAVVTILALIFTMPFVLAFDLKDIMPVFKTGTCMWNRWTCLCRCACIYVYIL
jgi:hypothetical protein